MKPNLVLGAGSLIVIAAGVGLALIANHHPPHAVSAVPQFFIPNGNPGDADRAGAFTVASDHAGTFAPAIAVRPRGASGDATNSVQFASDDTLVADSHTAIPEPATLALLASGALVLLARNRRSES